MQLTVLPNDVPAKVSKPKIHWKQVTKSDRMMIREKIGGELTNGPAEIPMSRLITLVRTYVLQVTDQCLFEELTPVDIQGILSSLGYKYVTVGGKQDRQKLTKALPHGGAHYSPKATKPMPQVDQTPSQPDVVQQGDRLELVLPNHAKSIIYEELPDAYTSIGLPPGFTIASIEAKKEEGGWGLLIRLITSIFG